MEPLGTLEILGTCCNRVVKLGRYHLNNLQRKYKSPYNLLSGTKVDGDEIYCTYASNQNVRALTCTCTSLLLHNFHNVLI